MTRIDDNLSFSPFRHNNSSLYPFPYSCDWRSSLRPDIWPPSFSTDLRAPFKCHLEPSQSGCCTLSSQGQHSRINSRPCGVGVSMTARCSCPIRTFTMCSHLTPHVSRLSLSLLARDNQNALFGPELILWPQNLVCACFNGRSKKWFLLTHNCPHSQATSAPLWQLALHQYKSSQSCLNNKGNGSCANCPQSKKDIQKVVSFWRCVAWTREQLNDNPFNGQWQTETESGIGTGTESLRQRKRRRERLDILEIRRLNSEIIVTLKSAPLNEFEKPQR